MNILSKQTYVILLLLLLTACVDYDALPFEGKVLPRRSGYVNQVTNDWIYYNLRTGEIFNGSKVNEHIKEGEQQNRLDWDLAFCGFALRTNGGSSGKGQGAATDLGKGNYESWKTVSQIPSDAEWIMDNGEVYITMAKRDWVSYAAKNGMTGVPWFDPNTGPKRTKTNANPLLAKAMRFSGPPPVYTPSYHTYVVRTADGKSYYKLQIVSWYNTKIEIGDSGGKISFYCDKLE